MKGNKLTRRTLLKSLAASTVFGTGVFAGTKPDRKIGVALVGLGHYSRDKLAPALMHTQYCELKGIVTGSPEKIPVWQKQYGIEDKNVYSYENMHEIAANDEIDVIYIVVPTALHKKYTVIAANAGKHVWCEKPMAMTKDDCQEMIDVCRRNKVQLTIGYRLHHEPITQTIMQYAKSHPYGKIQSMSLASAYYGDALPASNWRMQKAMGGGAMYDMGIYAVSAARYASGMEPLAITARHESTRPAAFTEVDETTHFDLEFPGGLMARCVTSVGLADVNHLRVNCENGWYELEPLCDYIPVRGRTSSGIILDKTVVNEQAKQMDDDALAIMKKGPVLVSGEEAMRDIRIVEAAFKSAESEKRIQL